VARGLARDLIDVVPNGIDLEHYTPASELRASRATILVLGRLKEYKRVDLVIDAVAVLTGEGLDVQLEIVGDGERLEALRAQARSLGIEDRVHFLGFVAEERKLEALRRAWVHVLTSPKEGWGISNLEAAACATPSVASDSPGLRESVVDGETGILVPHGEVGPLAEALGRLLRDRELHARLARGARSFAEKFSWEASADGVEAVLRRVVDETDRY
jgi:glycosyltransferase involved in cell wall biosynthesis